MLQCHPHADVFIRMVWETCDLAGPGLMAANTIFQFPSVAFSSARIIPVSGYRWNPSSTAMILSRLSNF